MNLIIAGLGFIWTFLSSVYCFTAPVSNGMLHVHRGLIHSCNSKNSVGIVFRATRTRFFFLPPATKTESNCPKYTRCKTSINSNESNELSRLVFLGTPEVAATTLRSLVEESVKENSVYEIVGVVTQPPKRRKRGGKIVPSPVGEAAEALGIPVLCPEKANDSEFLDTLEGMAPDLCITAAYGQYLPKRFLSMPTHGTLNIHPSLLPRWRGASPVQRSLEAGDKVLGVSVLYTVSKMDAGPIVSQRTWEIGDEDVQAGEALPYLFEQGTKALLEVLPAVLMGDVEGIPQDENAAVPAPLINPSEAQLRVWEESARVCHNRARGFSMWPGTHLFLRLHEEEPFQVKVIQSRCAGEIGSAEPTNVVEIPPGKGRGLIVVCFDGSQLELLKVQPSGKKIMDAKSFVNGLQGKRLHWVQHA